MIPAIVAGLNSVTGHFLGYSLHWIFSDVCRHNIIPVTQYFYGMTAFYAILFLHFCSEIISLFCAQLKIKFLTIPYPNKATKK